MNLMDTRKWNQYVFVDSETGGLNWREHPLLEVTYAIGLNEPVTLIPADIDFMLCLPKALEINKFLERYEGDDSGKWVDVPFDSIKEHDTWQPARAWLDYPEATQDEWNTFANAMANRYWVGANPRFDTEFVEAWYDPEPLAYQHRLIDMQAVAMGHWRLLTPPSFSEIIQRINEKENDYDTGYYIETQDHSSLGDTIATREVFAWFHDRPTYVELVNNRV